jgi:plastocyanin
MAFQRTILLAALALAACSDDGDEGGQGPDETPEGDVLVQNNRFEPGALQVEPGTTVVWAWASGGVQHNVTFADDVASGTQGSGTFERTFPTAGDYPYLCTIHGPSMSGTITVGSSSAPTGDGGGGGGGYPGGTPGGPVGY